MRLRRRTAFLCSAIAAVALNGCGSSLATTAPQPVAAPAAATVTRARATVARPRSAMDRLAGIARQRYSEEVNGAAVHKQLGEWPPIPCCCVPCDRATSPRCGPRCASSRPRRTPTSRGCGWCAVLASSPTRGWCSWWRRAEGAARCPRALSGDASALDPGCDRLRQVPAPQRPRRRGRPGTRIGARSHLATGRHPRRAALLGHRHHRGPPLPGAIVPRARPRRRDAADLDPEGS